MVPLWDATQVRRIRREPAMALRFSGSVSASCVVLSL